MSFVGARYSSAQTDRVLVSVGSSQRCRILGIHLSVPAGQNANLEFDAPTDVMIISTEQSVSLSVDRGQIVGGKGQSVLLTSSGAVSVGLIYELVGH